MFRKYFYKKIQRILIPLFTFIWWNKLEYYTNYDYSNTNYRYQIVKVKGWRTALVDAPGRGRSTITFCFNFKKLFGV
jgi:hypothetical protein